MYRFLNWNEQNALAKNLYEHLNKNATVVIGQFDIMDDRYDLQADELLKNAGFKEAANRGLRGFVFEK